MEKMRRLGKREIPAPQRLIEAVDRADNSIDAYCPCHDPAFSNQIVQREVI